MTERHFSSNYKRYALVVVTIVYAVNLLDRELVGLLMQPIKEDLHLTDTELGFLTGFAFALFYATLGIPIARWVDRGNRTTIASLAIGLWGLTVMSCLFITSFAQLAVARMAAAVGESGCKPPTYSLVGDYFPETRERTRAMTVYWMAGPLATLIGFVVGGWLNELYGWRVTFLLTGIPGVLLAVLVKGTLVDPRARPRGSEITKRAAPSLRTVLTTMWCTRSCRHLAISLILFYTMAFGLFPWNTAFMMRSHGMGSAELGVWMGTIGSVGSGIGVLLGGYLATRWFSGNERGQMLISAASLALGTPCYVAFLTLPDRYSALLMLLPVMILFSFFVAPTYTLLQRLVPDTMRATAMAVLMLSYNLVGMSLGPQIVGILSDLLAPDLGSNNSLRYAMLAMSSAALLSAYYLRQVGRTVEDDLRDVAGGRILRGGANESRRRRTLEAAGE